MNGFLQIGAVGVSRISVGHVGAFLKVEHLCAGVTKNLLLAKPNTCLLVYYPSGSSGLSCHKDNETVHTP